MESNKAQQEKLYSHVKFLTELRPYRNYRNLESLEKVCKYIESAFEECRLEHERQTWTAAGQQFNNVIATYNKHKKKRLIIGAHYDVCGDQPGADDNASAVAGLLETARMVAANKPDLDYRIDFVAFCLEEPPFFASDEMGSYIHAKSLHNQQADVIGMICYEMIGFFIDAPNSQPYPIAEWAKIYPNKANFIVVVGVSKYRNFNDKIYRMMTQESEIDVQVIHFPEENGLASMSDQRSYWRFGYPALMINDTAFIRNPNYHQKSDDIGTLDFDKMTAVVDSAYKAITGF
ncbi:MAG TPA: M28 family peptidase [Flavobacterium sp.]|jgi:hypothetical protein